MKTECLVLPHLNFTERRERGEPLLVNAARIP